MKIAILSDTHSGIRNGSDIFSDYQERFYSTIFFPYLKENGIKRIIHLGDYYDQRRTINIKTIEQNRKMFLDVIRSRGIHMDIIPGNHDVAYKDTNDLCSLKELLGHYVDCVDIHMDPKVIDYDGLNIALLPWINRSNEKECGDFIASCSAPILMGHLELAGFKFLGNSGMVSRGAGISQFCRFESVYSGHYHTKSSSGNVTYLGAPMEYTWADCDDPKFFHVFDTDTRTIQPVRNPITLFKKIYYNNGPEEDVSENDIKGKYITVIIVRKSDLFEFDQFMDRIQSYGPISVSIQESFDDLLEDVEDSESYKLEDTTTIISNYIDAIDCEFDRDLLKKILFQLHTEALNYDAI